MPFDKDHEAVVKFREDDDEKPPNFLYWLLALLAGAALWFGVFEVLGWIMGAL